MTNLLQNIDFRYQILIQMAPISISWIPDSVIYNLYGNPDKQ